MNNFTVPRITQGMATPDKFNQPLIYIQSALNSLSSNISQATNKSAVLQWQAPLDSTVSVGDLVYFDSQATNANFKPALAALLGIPGAQGQSVQAPSSRVQGLVISVDPPVLLRNGYYQSSVIQATLGVGAQAGIYYLSPQTAGRATKTPGWNLRQPCLSYYGDGKFSLFSNYLAHDNHHHGSVVLSGWEQSAHYSGTESVQGEFYCQVKTTQHMGQLSSQTSAVFYNGLLDTKQFAFGKDVVWFKGNQAPANGSVVVFNNYPFAYGDSVVRVINSRTLTTTHTNGTYTIDMPAYTQVNYDRGAQAVYKISGTNIYYIPVVSSIQAGLGIRALNRGSGKYQISSTRYTDRPTPATDFRLNGTQRVATDILTYTVFPASATTSFVMSLPVAYEDAVATGSVRVWATSRGPGSGRIRATLYWLPIDQTGETYTQIPGTEIGQVNLMLSNTSTNTLGYQESSALQFSFQNTGTLIAKMQAAGPAGDIYIHQAGFKLDLLGAESDSQNSDAVSTQIRDQVLDVLEQVVTYNANYEG